VILIEELKNKSSLVL